MRRRSAVAGRGAAVVLVTTLALGCGGPRNSLNTASSVCFRSLVVAQEAVHHRGKLVGVHRVTASSFARQVPAAAAAAATTGNVCLLAFHGDYRPGSVTGAPTSASGHYAIVAVTAGRPRLLAARLTDELPTRFRHRT